MVVAPLAAPLAAQTAHPDFSGKWNLDTTASNLGMGGVTGTVTITQTDKTVKLEQHVTSPMGSQDATLSYNIDGTPSKNTVGGQGMTVDVNSTTAWEGNTLVVTSEADVQGQTVRTTERWSLDETGKVLTLDTNLNVSGQSMSRKQVFKKA
jgi:hypothetical protein